MADDDDKAIVVNLAIKDQTVFAKLELFLKIDSAGTWKYGHYSSLVGSSNNNFLLLPVNGWYHSLLHLGIGRKWKVVFLK
jgi:hypothetical protein